MSTDLEPHRPPFRRSDTVPKKRRTALIAMIIVAVALAIAGIAITLAHRTPAQAPGGGGRFGGGARGGAGGPNAPPQPVGVAQVTTGDIRLTLNALGTVTPLRSVTVGAQVAGQLQKVNFKEGQMVTQGDLLAEIDPRTYQAAVDQAEGTRARDQALLDNAKTDLARYETLFKEDSIARQQLDSQRSLVHQYEGTLKADEGQIGAAKVNLTYTRIVAPVSGRVGLRQVDPGNNVQNGTAIVVITQLEPIDVLFTLPEDNLPSVLKKLHAATPLGVDVYDRSGQTKLASGTLASLDNQIDTSTGTVKAKAEFGNSDQTLFPNQFVNARLLLDTLHGVTVVPTTALQQGANGSFVYVVNEDHTVSVRNVKTGATEGEHTQVTDGAKVGETVVTEGVDRLREGAKVLLPGEAPPQAAEGGRGPHRGEGRGADGKDAKSGDEAQGQRGDGQRGDGQRRHRGGDQPDAASGDKGPASTQQKPAPSETKDQDPSKKDGAKKDGSQ